MNMHEDVNKEHNEDKVIYNNTFPQLIFPTVFYTRNLVIHILGAVIAIILTAFCAVFIADSLTIIPITFLALIFLVTETVFYIIYTFVKVILD